MVRSDVLLNLSILKRTRRGEAGRLEGRRNLKCSLICVRANRLRSYLRFIDPRTNNILTNETNKEDSLK